MEVDPALQPRTVDVPRANRSARSPSSSPYDPTMLLQRPTQPSDGRPRRRQERNSLGGVDGRDDLLLVVELVAGDGRTRTRRSDPCRCASAHRRCRRPRIGDGRRERPDSLTCASSRTMIWSSNAQTLVRPVKRAAM